MTVVPAEVTPGLVLQLDSKRLRKTRDSRTNAEIGAEGDRAVGEVHTFLLVGVDATSGLCTAVPLFAKTAVGNQPLEEPGRSGGDTSWRETPVYFSRWQHWRIPMATLLAAVEDDGTTDATRRRYAAEDRTALDDIRSWEKKNRSAYRIA